MKPFLFSLFIIAVFIICVLIATMVEKIEENKKDDSLVSDKMLSEDEKQKIRAEEYIDLYTKLKSMDKIYITDQGTVLNSKPHTFKDFINNQKLPSKLELTWDILADNNVKIKDIIQRIEDNAPYPPDTLAHLEFDTLRVTSEQVKMIHATHLDDSNLLLIDRDYPLYIKLNSLNAYTSLLYVVYQAGYEYDDKNLDRRHPTRPTKH